MLARHKSYQVVATDLLLEAVLLSRRYASAQRLEGRDPGRVHSEVQDGRALTYADGSFDAAYSVSVLEHIPDSGDSAAIRELIRVVRPGGVVVVTVPYDRNYRETFVKGPVYERKPIGSEAIFYERHYDRETLAKRLLSSERAEVVDLSFWGEGADVPALAGWLRGGGCVLAMPSPRHRDPIARTCGRLGPLSRSL